MDNLKFSKSGTIVYLDTINVEETFINAVKANPIPSTSGTPNDVLLVNLNKFEDRFTVDGYLSEGKNETDETSSSAKDKKANLRTMFIAGSVITMTYDGTDYEVAMEKASIKEVSRDLVNNDDTIRYTVKLTMIVGADVI